MRSSARNNSHLQYGAQTVALHSDTLIYSGVRNCYCTPRNQKNLYFTQITVVFQSYNMRPTLALPSKFNFGNQHPLPAVFLNMELPVTDQVQTVAGATAAIQTLYQCLKKI